MKQECGVKLEYQSQPRKANKPNINAIYYIMHILNWCKLKIL